MADDYIGIADQASGAGIGDVRVRSRTIGAVTAKEQYVIEADERVSTGIYRAHAGLFTVQASAHAATAGYFWLVNTSSSLLVAVRRVEICPTPTAVTAFPSAPRILMERCTFTGTPTGATVTPAKCHRTSQNGQTADSANVATLRTASTGMTLAAGEMSESFQIMPILTAVGWASPIEQEYAPSNDAQIVLANGEGIVLRQPDAGTASDTRRFNCDVVWQEFTLP